MIVCAGTVLVDCIMTESGSEAVADDISLSPGGEAFNEAIGLARLGETVLLCAPVGDDFAGSAIKELLSDEGVSVCSDYAGKTLVSLLTVDDAGERRSRVSRAHDLGGWKPCLPEGSPAFVTMASLFRPPFLDPEACFEFACKAKASGAVLLADTKLPKGSDPLLSDYADTLKLLDLITPNEAEALHYTGAADAREAAEIFRSLGVKNVIIKQGAGGGLCLPEGGDAFTYPAYPVHCVDGIGAGDAFTAGLIHSLSAGSSLRGPDGSTLLGFDGAPLKEALHFASACGALSTTMRGAVSALRSEGQVMGFMAENGAGAKQGR